MTENINKNIEKKLDTVIGLLQYLLALEFYKSGLTKEAISKRLRVANATVVKMLKGVNKEQ